MIEKIRHLAYKLKIPPHWKIHPVFTIAQLESYISGDPYKRELPKQPQELSIERKVKEELFVVDCLLNKRVVKKGNRLATEYLVKWKGYSPEFDRWCNVKILDGAKDQIKVYEKDLSAATTLITPNSSSPSITVPVPSPIPESKTRNQSANCQRKPLLRLTAPRPPQNSNKT